MPTLPLPAPGGGPGASAVQAHTALPQLKLTALCRPAAGGGPGAPAAQPLTALPQLTLSHSCAAATHLTLCPSLPQVADLEPLLYSRALQMGEEKKSKPVRLGDAVAQGIIANQTLAYFIGRTWLFFKRVGKGLAGGRMRAQ